MLGWNDLLLPLCVLPLPRIIAAMNEIIKLVFPDLRYGGDPDIERYFELRKTGKLSHALTIYNRSLRVRYPDDASRVRLLKLYRENDPRYPSYQESLVLEFATLISVRIRSNIDLIVAPLERADLSDALRALKAVESVLSRLPGETEGALDLLTRYDQFARVLGHRELLVRRALDLVREYDAVSRADAPSEYDFIARSAAIEARRRAVARPSSGADATEERYDFVSGSATLEQKHKNAKKPNHSYFDPDRIKFTQAEKTRVEISPSLTRREDKVIALCAKYWPQAKDAAFERVVFLYSRKFGGSHFEVFRAIKLGRMRGSTDDEILSAVSGILTTSYSYSVSGDLYMQIMWRRLRARMDEKMVAERLAAPGPVATTRAGPRPAPEARVRTRPVVPATPARVISPTLRPAVKAKGGRLLARVPTGPEPVREIRAKHGSISDSIRKLSGRTYDVYREIFLEKVRDHIHRTLLSSQTRSHGIFGTATNDAEDQVYGFITAHYDDPFMDWENSAERTVVEALGFTMPSLMPIIAACFKKL